MSLTTKKERVQMIRLASGAESLHALASDTSAPEAERLEAAQALAQIFLTHFELLIAALRKAGK